MRLAVAFAAALAVSVLAVTAGVLAGCRWWDGLDDEGGLW